MPRRRIRRRERHRALKVLPHHEGILDGGAGAVELADAREADRVPLVRRAQPVVALQRVLRRRQRLTHQRLFFLLRLAIGQLLARARVAPIELRIVGSGRKRLFQHAVEGVVLVAVEHPVRHH